jgi:hypothetical protein
MCLTVQSFHLTVVSRQQEDLEEGLIEERSKILVKVIKSVYELEIK